MDMRMWQEVQKNALTFASKNQVSDTNHIAHQGLHHDKDGKYSFHGSGCRAWTFRIKEKYSPKGACWMVDMVGPAARCSMCTTGLMKPGTNHAIQR